MNNGFKGSIRLPLNRPEYVTVPEAFITALAWKIYDAPRLLERTGAKPIGLFFRGTTPKGNNVEFRSTDPADLSGLASALDEAGIKSEGSGELLAAAVLNSVLGIRVERSDIQPSSPISPSFALLQNTRGLLGKENPFDIGDVLQSMYRLGLREGQDCLGVAERWGRAAVRRMDIDPLVASLDRAIDLALVHREAKEEMPSREVSELQGQFAGTPYEWFVTAWNRLTDPSWVDALPARVWVDWATTVLRLAFGAGFLWESAWYLAVAREVAQKEPIREWREVQASLPETIPWASSRAGTAARDIAPKLSRRVHQGELARRALDGWMKSSGAERLDFQDAIQLMRDDAELRAEMLAALGSNQKVNSGTNLWEAVKYALMTRDVSGNNPDYYGLLQSRGRFLTVSPGTEWIAVVASLACEVPGGTTDVKQVLVSLEGLGMRPELSDLIALLEKAGMARGSADADSGVLVESAF